MSLTRHQAELLRFIDGYIKDSGGVSPSFEDMRAAVHLSSKSGIHRMLTALDERGYIKRIPYRARCITVLKRLDGAPTEATAYRRMRDFVSRIADFTPGGVDCEDDAATIDSLREEARRVLEAVP